MADRRMLWKVVSISRKVNALSLPAALLWTWAIPFFDRDGYLETEPDYLKVNVVPRRKEFTLGRIEDLVKEIEGSGLWEAFRDSRGVRLARDPRFSEYQKIQYDREGPSKWAQNGLKPIDSKSSPRVLLEHSNQDKIRGEEIKREKKKEKEEKKAGRAKLEDRREFDRGLAHVREILNGAKGK